MLFPILRFLYGQQFGYRNTYCIWSIFSWSKRGPHKRAPMHRASAIPQGDTETESERASRTHAREGERERVSTCASCVYVCPDALYDGGDGGCQRLPRSLIPSSQQLGSEQGGEAVWRQSLERKYNRWKGLIGRINSTVHK